MGKLLLNKRFVCFALACTLLLFTAGCNSPATEEETPAAPDTEEVAEEILGASEADETEEAADDEEAGSTNAEEAAKKVQSKTSQSTQSGSFKHVVKQEINGMVEKNKDEGWWKLD